MLREGEAGGGTGGEALAAASAAAARSGFPVLVEEFIDGQEISVETQSADGVHELVALTEKVLAPGTFPVEVGHQMPARLSPVIRERCLTTTMTLLTAIGHRVGPAHTEIRIRDGVPYVVETHTRYGGDRIWELAGLTTGRYAVADTLAALATLPSPERSPAAAAAAVRFVTGTPGIVTAIDGLDAANADPSVVRVSMDVTVGDTVRELRDSNDRLGYVLAVGETVDAAVAAAEQATARIRVTVR